MRVVVFFLHSQRWSHLPCSHLVTAWSSWQWQLLLYVPTPTVRCQQADCDTFQVSFYRSPFIHLLELGALVQRSDLHKYVMHGELLGMVYLKLGNDFPHSQSFPFDKVSQWFVCLRLCLPPIAMCFVQLKSLALRVLLPTCSIRPAALRGLRPCQNTIWNVSSTSLESNGFHWTELWPAVCRQSVTYW